MAEETNVPGAIGNSDLLFCELGFDDWPLLDTDGVERILFEVAC